jgi:tetratricopeptide (TPR) repeat protein
MFFSLKPKPGAKAATPTASPADPNVPAEAPKAFEKGAIATGKKDKIEEGVRQLEKALSLYPKFLEALVKLGAAYMDLQQWDKAEPAFKKALELEPKTANALFALGEIYLRQKKTDEAEKVLLQGLQIDDKSAPAHLALARTYWETASNVKDEAQAKPSLEKAYDQVNQSLKLNPEVAQAHLVKGNLLLRVRRAADAQHEYEEYLRLEPKGAFAEQTRVIVEKIKKALATEEKK